ncbi:hypothetical protein D3C78_933840 [compost metagenome]
MDNDRKDPINMQKEQAADYNQDTVPAPNNGPFGQGPAFSNSDSDLVVVQKQSGLGIASFVLGLVSIILIIIAIVLGSLFAAQVTDSGLTPTEAADPAVVEQTLEEMDSSAFVQIILASIFIFGALGLAFVGLILGLIGVFSKHRRKTFSIIGLILNGILVVGAIVLLVIGLTFSAAAGV